MRDAATHGVNDENLKYVMRILGDLPLVAFYGTLLGIIREGATLKNDDDVDLVCDIKFREEIIERLQAEGCSCDLEIWPNNLSKNFLQTKISNKLGIGYVDIYFIEKRGEDYFDRWSFWGYPKNESMYIRFPAVWITDFTVWLFEDIEVKIPKNPDAVLEFLYGKNWKVPKTKGRDYVTIQFRGKPLHIPRPFTNIARLYNKILKLLGGIVAS